MRGPRARRGLRAATGAAAVDRAERADRVSVTVDDRDSGVGDHVQVADRQVMAHQGVLAGRRGCGSPRGRPLGCSGRLKAELFQSQAHPTILFALAEAAEDSRGAVATSPLGQRLPTDHVGGTGFPLGDGHLRNSKRSVAEVARLGDDPARDRRRHADRVCSCHRLSDLGAGVEHPVVAACSVGSIGGVS